MLLTARFLQNYELNAVEFPMANLTSLVPDLIQYHQGKEGK